MGIDIQYISVFKSAPKHINILDIQILIIIIFEIQHVFINVVQNNVSVYSSQMYLTFVCLSPVDM